MSGNICGHWQTNCSEHVLMHLRLVSTCNYRAFPLISNTCVVGHVVGLLQGLWAEVEGFPSMPVGR
eukprot:3251570-Amphidinium_carterae.1